MGRPKLDIPEKQVQKLAKLGASNRDIADFFGCDESTIRGRFPAILAKGRAERKNRLRELQWQRAEGGSDTMLIWLGKNDLGQTDKHVTETRDLTAEKMAGEAAAARATLAKKMGTLTTDAPEPTAS